MRNDRGMALIVVTVTVLLVMAIGAALALTTSSEALISQNFQASQRALYAADAAAEWAVADLPAVVDDWPTLLNTNVTSWFVDGAESGWRALPDGSLVDFGAIVQQNGSWKPYAFGLLKNLLPAAPPGFDASAFYIAVFVSADASASDRLNVRAEALGPRGAHKTVEMCVLRDAAGVHPVSWAEVR